MIPLRTLLHGSFLGLCAHAAACSDSGGVPRAGSLAATPGGAGSGSLPPSSDTMLAADLFPPSDHEVHPSAGCGKPPPSPAPTTLTSGGQEGHLLLSVPFNYDPNTPQALGFVFHG